MMTVSGIAAEGLSPNFESSRIAAESACPQLTAVLGTDTELRFAVIPVILKTFCEKSSCKDIKNPSIDNEIFHVFLQKNLKRDRPLSVFPNPTNTYIKYLQEKRKGSLKNSPAAVINQQRGSISERTHKCLTPVCQ